MAAVIRRYGFGGGFVWSDELAIWLNVALVAVGAPLAATSALAMRLDVVVRRLPARGRRIAAVLADAVAVHGSLVLALGGAAVAGLVGGTSTVLGLPEALRFAAFSLGGGLTVLVVLARAALERGAPASLASGALGLVLYLLAQQATGLLVDPPSLVAGIVAALGLVLGAPLPLAFLAAVSATGPFGGLLPEPAIVQNAVSGVSKFLLLAIPFFLLAGELLTAGGLAERLVRFAASLVGHWRAGLAQTTLVSSVLFSGASGSSVANAAFGAKVMAPALVARGYPKAAGGGDRRRGVDAGQHHPALHRLPDPRCGNEPLGRSAARRRLRRRPRARGRARGRHPSHRARTGRDRAAGDRRRAGPKLRRGAAGDRARDRGRGRHPLRRGDDHRGLGARRRLRPRRLPGAAQPQRPCRGPGAAQGRRRRRRRSAC